MCPAWGREIIANTIEYEMVEYALEATDAVVMRYSRNHTPLPAVNQLDRLVHCHIYVHKIWQRERLLR